jgi:hypothetical protein
VLSWESWSSVETKDIRDIEVLQRSRTVLDRLVIKILALGSCLSTQPACRTCAADGVA